MTDNLTNNGNFADKRMGSTQVRKLITKILSSTGDIRFTEYCEKRMLERSITAPTVVNVLERGQVFDGEEYIHEGFTQWRYRVETNRYRIVVTFEVETEVIVINAIDLKPHLSEVKKGEKDNE